MLAVTQKMDFITQKRDLYLSDIADFTIYSFSKHLL